MEIVYRFNIGDIVRISQDICFLRNHSFQGVVGEVKRRSPCNGGLIYIEPIYKKDKNKLKKYLRNGKSYYKWICVRQNLLELDVIGTMRYGKG